ncbi:MAG: glycosyltransferase family 39 protein, partial [Elusimicrobiales bacterium]|nr:glycosyltransferase family 39 protein [Elusimicrobiales bacterium]
MGRFRDFLSGNAAGAALFLAPLPAAAWFLADPAAAGAFLSFGGYWCMLLLALVWAVLLSARLRASLPSLRANAAGLLFSLAAASAVFLAVKPGFRVLADEANLLGVSRSMTFERRTDNVTMAKRYYFNLRPLLREREKRPYMFPFAVSVLHSVSGYRPANAFAVNFVLLAALLGAVFVFFRGLYGPPAAYAAVLLTASHPLLALTASSGGMDFMSAAFMFFSFLALRRFLGEPSRDSFSLLWATLLVMANVRYEGPAVMAAVVLGLLAARRLKWEFLASWPVFLTSLVMLPSFCQRFCLPTDFETPGGSPAFAAGNIAHHTLAFLKVHFEGFKFPYSLPVFFAGVAGAAYGLRKWLDPRGERPDVVRPLFLISLAGLAVYWIVTVSY